MTFSSSPGGSPPPQLPSASARHRAATTAWFSLVCLLALSAACGDDAAGDTTSPDTGALPDDVPSDDATSGGDVPGPPPTPQPDGAACSADAECQGGACLGPLDGFPDGFCTVRNCDSARDCNGGGADVACLRGAFNGNLCVPLCRSAADCREGYDCVAVPGGGAYCGPHWAGDALNPVCAPGSPDDPSIRSPFPGRPLASERRISFTVPDNATSFMILPYSRTVRLFLDRLEAPDGSVVSVEEYAGYAFSPFIFEQIAPILYPAGPQFVDGLIPGEWTAVVAFEGNATDELCHVVHIETASYDALDGLLFLDLNLYLVGVPNLTAATAATNPNYLDMLAAFQESLGDAGLAVGDVRYFDVTGEVRNRFTLIREDSEAFELVRLARQPGPTEGDLMSVNVFFIQGFAGDMSGTLGISAGIPGSAGLHGGPGGGLIFSSASLQRSGGRLVGQTLSHEVGHYLGLFHTTEFNFLGQDHLEDTPVCPTIGRGSSACPDFTNLMYPAAANRPRTELTPGQAQILRANPLTRSVSRSATTTRRTAPEVLR